MSLKAERVKDLGPRSVGDNDEQEQSLSAYLVSGCFCLMVSTVLPQCMNPAPYGLFCLFHNGQTWFRS